MTSNACGIHSTPQSSVRALWPKYRFRSGPPQILISKFRGAAANFEVDFDCQNVSVLAQDRAYRRRTPRCAGTSRLCPLARPFCRARGRRPRVRGGWRPEAAIGGVGSAERYWRRDRASLGCVCRPSARGCADIARLCPLARPFCRERAPAACKKWLAAWRPEAAFGGVSVRC